MHYCNWAVDARVLPNCIFEVALLSWSHTPCLDRQSDCDGTVTRIVERQRQSPRLGGAARAGQPGEMGSEVAGAAPERLERVVVSTKCCESDQSQFGRSHTAPGHY